MAIRVEHKPPIAGQADIAFKSGSGARKERLRLQEQDRQKIQAQFALAFRAQAESERRTDIQSNQFQQQFEARTDEAEKRSALADRSQGLAERRQDFTEQQFEEAPERQNNQAIAKENLLRDNIQWRFTESQQQQLRILNDKKAAVDQQLAANEITPDQADLFMEELNKKFLSINPVPDYREKPNNQGDFDNSIVFDSEGNAFIRDSKGDFKPIKSKDTIGTVSFSDYQKIYTSIDSQLSGNSETGFADPAVVRQKTEDAIAAYQSFISGGTPAVEGELSKGVNKFSETGLLVKDQQFGPGQTPTETINAVISQMPKKQQGKMVKQVEEARTNKFSDEEILAFLLRAN